jgi:DNA-binding transcriptional regulator YhcF (GntR family)
MNIMQRNESKYKQVENSVINGIQTGKYKRGDWIPSINDFRKTFNLSRDTVFAAIRRLKAKGIIKSCPGIGYYVTSESIPEKQNIFLLFNELNDFKEDLYNSFIEAVGQCVQVNIYFHNYNRHVFEKLITEANNNYTDYVIMSGKFDGIEPLLSTLSGRVFLLDHFHSELKGKFSSVFQNFEKDTYEALVFGLNYLEKYRRIIMVQKDKKEPEERCTGLRVFCTEYEFKYLYINEIKNRRIKCGDVFIVVRDRDLVELLKQAEKQNFTSGKEFGIISCNDTPLKEIIAGGITTLSTDFKLMGKTMAALINKKTIETIENPWNLNIRNSL